MNQQESINKMGFHQQTNNESSIEEKAINFQKLYGLNLNDKLEKKNNLSYLSWANAWSEFKKIYPNAQYEVVKDPNNHLPYFVDERMGIIVYTKVFADDLEYECWLPVMDNTNRAMKLQPYTYQVWDGYKKQYIEKVVEPATMFDINRTIMRCLVKNLAFFGLGLYIYAGEDIPEQIDVQQAPVPEPTKRGRRTTTTQSPESQQSSSIPDRYQGIRTALNNCQNLEQLVMLYKSHLLEVEGNPQVKELFTNRKNELAA